ncbi:hypothetical protein T09_10411 [Trichinella sp. T9]|nr:hypothetical protein T09_2891 [Trichinella sp. T9]KRX51373.1 hypothetical protein T09_10411 [Trichinella sp. T9]
MLMAQRRRQTLLRHRWPGWVNLYPKCSIHHQLKFLEIQKKVIVKAFRKTIQVWSRRNNWAESILPHSQNKNQTVESALTACTDPADIFAIFNDTTAQVENWAKSNICHFII